MLLLSFSPSNTPLSSSSSSSPKSHLRLNVSFFFVTLSKDLEDDVEEFLTDDEDVNPNDESENDLGLTLDVLDLVLECWDAIALRCCCLVVS